MLSVFHNTWRRFFRNKEYMKAIIVTPILMLFIFSYLFAYNSAQKIVVINKDTGLVGQTVENAVESLEGIQLLEVNEDDIAKKIKTRSVEVAIIVHEDATIEFISTGSSEVSPLLARVIEQRIKALSTEASQPVSQVSVNEAPKKGIPVNNSLGVIVFKLITGGSLLASLLIHERKTGLNGRIKLSGIRSSSYLAGIGLAYLISSMIASVMYYIAARLANFDFGMENTIQVLIILLSANILSAALYILFATILNEDGLLWYIAVIVVLPSSILSGAFWPFEYMPKIMQWIGSMLPQRWIVQAIENLQSGLGFTAALPYMLAVIALSIVLFAIASWRMKQRRRSAF
ncbi:ABC transporter permease [Paenibacillaceae bacterium WGS1546]|uniref:ABC transporter permease n=1 Tax=Cohnella sp. WGS1546 TaxID=3366810 RepID=UPI00372D2E66